MRKIMVLNTKGGSGKTMLATNLASYYAQQSATVTLADFDPQGSSMGWLAARPEQAPAIYGVAVTEGRLRPPRRTDYLIVDTPAARHGRELTRLLLRAETILIPVQPSPTDMRAAAEFIQKLLRLGKVSRKQVKVALVANRLRETHSIGGLMERVLGAVSIPFATETTRFNQSLQEFLDRAKVPFIASIRDSETYLRADARGLGVFELEGADAEQARGDWQPLIQWLDSRRSIPRKPAKRPATPAGRKSRTKKAR